MDFNGNKTSVSSIINDFINNIESNVLNPDESLSANPSSFIELLTCTLGKLSTYSFYNMLMSKREVQPSTAILTKSLLRHLKSDDLASIYGTPSELGFILSFGERALINNAISTGESGKYKVTLNKDTVFSIADKPKYMLDYNIDIFITKNLYNTTENNSIYAVYDTSDKDGGSLLTVNNPFITSRNDVILDNEKLFTMFIPLKQYERTYHIIELSGENSDIDIEYSNSLYGFVVLYKEPSSNSYTQVNTYLEGDSFSNGVSYAIDNSTEDKGVIHIKFSKLPDAFSPTNGTLRIIVYTTYGSKGNFSINNIDDASLGDLSLSLAQDTSSPYQNALTTLVPILSLSGTESSGGKDALKLEEIRSLVIDKQLDTIITPNTLSKYANKMGFSSYKLRHDLIDYSYRLSSFLSDDNGFVIPSKMINAMFSFSKVPLLTETGVRIISPYDVFKDNGNALEYTVKQGNEIEAYSDYVESYNKKESSDFVFPYFLLVSNGNKIEANVYDLSCDVNRSTSFKYLTNSILDKTSVVSASIYRNPLSVEKITINENEEKLRDFYEISFDVYTSEVIIDHLKNLQYNEKPYVKFKIILSNKTDTSQYVHTIDLSNCQYDEENLFIRCKGYLKTNNNILDKNKVCITENSLIRIPYSSGQYNFYFVDSLIDVKIAIIYKETQSSPLQRSEYDSYLSESEINEGYYIGVLYNIDEVSLATDMSEHISITPDIILSQPVYKTATEDIPDTYDEPQYKMDGNNYVVEEKELLYPDGTTKKEKQFVLLHNVGDIKKELDGRIGTYDVVTKKFSNQSSDTGIYNNSDVLGGVSVFAQTYYNGFVIFAGSDGRVGCYYTKNKTWYEYNSTIQTFKVESSTLYTIKNDGSAMGYEAIRGMFVIERNNKSEAILVAYGDKGRVVSCDLSTNTWRSYDGSYGNRISNIYNNGQCLGDEAIYAHNSYKNSNENDIYVLAGGSGRVCSYNATTNTWYPYNYNGETNNAYVFTDGKYQNYKAIFTISKYIDSIMYFSGVEGRISQLNIASGRFSEFNDGSVINNVSVYTSGIISGYYYIAGEKGYVASYDLSKNVWNTYNSESSLSSNGSHMGNENINASLCYDVNIIFAGGEGRICYFNTISLEWTAYNSSDNNSIINDGSFIGNTISSILFDAINTNNTIFFSGKSGNIVYKYKKGDFMKDSNGNFLVETPSEQICYLRHIPAYNRLYAVESNYFSILSSYNNLMYKINEMSNIFPDGCTLCLGIKNTSGKSEKFYFYDKKSGEKTFLNSLAIDLSFGVKFDNSTGNNNTEFYIEDIKQAVLSYIKNIQVDVNESITLSINEMLDKIKESIPSIRYFEFYSLNGYDYSVCQTIFYDGDVYSSSEDQNEYLCINTIIDEPKSDIYNQNVVFKPSIDIIVL